jgi:hypothetical protein
MAVMRGLTLALALFGAVQGVQPDLDCGRPAAGQELLGRLRLSEIEGKEDVSRTAMWEAFGRCADLPSAADCRDTARREFEAAWEREKAAIEAKYERLLRDFLMQCRASIA